MADIPCIEFPKAGSLSITLPFGAELRSLTNIADGPPTNCALAHSLMLQITPMLASMACMLKVLKVIAALKTTVESAFTQTGDLISALDGIADCLGIVLGPIPICQMVKGILALILAYLGCLIEAMESILNFQIGIDLNAAQGNPVLLASLECAQNNAQSSMTSMMGAMQGIEPILQLVNIALEIVGEDPIATPPLAATTPSLADLAAGVDPLEPIKAVRDALQIAHDALPC